MSLRFSDITVNDHFIDFNGITYQKIANSGDGCCSVGLNAIPINTGVGATAQFFAERLIIAHAGFSDDYDDTNTGVEFFGEQFNVGDNLLQTQEFLYIGSGNCPGPLRCARQPSEIANFAIDRGIVYSTLESPTGGLNVGSTTDRTADFITTALFKFPSSDLTSGDLYSIRIGADNLLDTTYTYFGCRINGSGGLGVEYGTNTGAIELSEDYLANYSGQSVYLSCNYNFDTTVAVITAKSPNAGLTTVMSPSGNAVNATLVTIMGFAPADNRVGLGHWQTMMTPP